MSAQERAEQLANVLNAKGKLRRNIIELGTPIIEAAARDAYNAAIADAVEACMQELIEYAHDSWEINHNKGCANCASAIEALKK